MAYSAAKGGLIAFTRALAKEVARTGITVNAVSPGPVDTHMLGPFSPEERAQIADQIPIGRLGTPGTWLGRFCFSPCRTATGSLGKPFGRTVDNTLEGP